MSRGDVDPTLIHPEHTLRPGVVESQLSAPNQVLADYYRRNYLGYEPTAKDFVSIDQETLAQMARLTRPQAKKALGELTRQWVQDSMIRSAEVWKLENELKQTKIPEWQGKIDAIARLLIFQDDHARNQEDLEVKAKELAQECGKSIMDAISEWVKSHVRIADRELQLGLIKNRIRLLADSQIKDLDDESKDPQPRGHWSPEDGPAYDALPAALQTAVDTLAEKLGQEQPFPKALLLSMLNGELPLPDKLREQDLRGKKFYPDREVVRRAVGGDPRELFARQIIYERTRDSQKLYPAYTEIPAMEISAMKLDQAA